MTQTYFNGGTMGFAYQFEIQPKVVRVKTLNVEVDFLNKISVRLLGLVDFYNCQYLFGRECISV